MIPQQILDHEIQKRVKDGWHLVSRTETTAQLARPHPWSFFWLIVFCFLYVFLRKREDYLYIEVAPNGKVITRQS